MSNSNDGNIFHPYLMHFTIYIDTCTAVKTSRKQNRAMALEKNSFSFRKKSLRDYQFQVATVKIYPLIFNILHVKKSNQINN